MISQVIGEVRTHWGVCCELNLVMLSCMLLTQGSSRQYAHAFKDIQCVEESLWNIFILSSCQKYIRVTSKNHAWSEVLSTKDQTVCLSSPW